MLQRRSFRRLMAAAFALGVVGISKAASANPVEEFYRNKNINLMVGFAPGGGADLWGRFLARHLGSFIPGKPNVVVQNMPGASGFRAVGYTFNIAPMDGTNLVLPVPTALTAPSLGVANVTWDVFKFQWIGNLNRDSVGCVAMGKSGIKSIADAKDRQIIFGADGMDDPAAQQPRALANLLGFNIKVIAGFKGTGHALLSLESGEIDARCAFFASQALSERRADLDAGKLVPIMQVGSRKHAIFGNAPMVYDFARTEDERKIMQFIFGSTEITRPVAVGPGVPKDRVDVLREAFWTAANSKQLRDDAARLNLVVDPMDWKETEAAIRASIDFDPSIIDRAKKMIAY
ncbi:MAG: hypothetical protein Q8M31_18510 [Beijerinckiaceae bacterium]|nr:hypothetical protein [Beijerinckiaceae bacterium]